MLFSLDFGLRGFWLLKLLDNISLKQPTIFVNRRDSLSSISTVYSWDWLNDVVFIIFNCFIKFFSFIIISVDSIIKIYNLILIKLLF